MGQDTTRTDEERREELRIRIEAGEKRHEARSFADQARDAAGEAVEFTKKHPFAVIGGAIAIGLAIGAMTKPGRKATRRTGAFAALASEAALAFGAKLLDQAGDFGSEAAKASRGFGKDAAYRLDIAGDALRSTSRKAAKQGTRAYKELRGRFTH